MIKEKHDLSCVLCQQFYTKKERCPRRLLCGHTLCTACLAHLIKTQSCKCPTCARPFLASSETQLPTDFTVYKKLSNTNNESVNVQLAPVKNITGTPLLNSISFREQDSNEIGNPKLTPQQSTGYSEADLKFNSNLVSPKPFKHQLPLISKMSNINRSYKSANDFRTMDVVDIPRQVMPANTITQDDIQSIPPPSAVMRPLTSPNMPATPFIPTFQPEETQQLSKNKIAQYLPAKVKTLPILHEMPETSSVTSTPVAKLRSIQQIRMDLQDNKYGFPQNIPKPLKRSSLSTESLVESKNAKIQSFNKSSVNGILQSEPSFDNKSREISLEQNYDGIDETDHALRMMAVKTRDPNDNIMQPHNCSSIKFTPNSESIHEASNSPDNRVTKLKPGMSMNEENIKESSDLNQENGKPEKFRDNKIVSSMLTNEADTAARIEGKYSATWKPMLTNSPINMKLLSKCPESAQKTDKDFKINKRILKRQAPIPDENRISRLQSSSPSIKDEEKPSNITRGSNKLYLKGSSKRKAPSPFPYTSDLHETSPSAPNNSSENTLKVQSFVTPEGVIESATKQRAPIPESLALKDEKELPLTTESSLQSPVTKYSSNLGDVKQLDQSIVNKTQTKYEQRPYTPSPSSFIPNESNEKPMKLNEIELTSAVNNSCAAVNQKKSSTQLVNDTRIEFDTDSVEEQNNFTSESEEKLESKTGIDENREKGSYKHLYHSLLTKDNSESTKAVSITSQLQEQIKSTDHIESPRPLYIAKIYSGELQIGSVSSKEEGSYEGPQRGEPNVNMHEDLIGKHLKRENSVHNDWIKKLIKSTASDTKGQLQSKDENPSGMFEKSGMPRSEEEILMNIEISDAKSTKYSDPIKKANTDSKESPQQLQNFKSEGRYKSPYLVERGSLSLREKRTLMATSKDNAIHTHINENQLITKADDHNETTKCNTLPYKKEPDMQRMMMNSHSKPLKEEYKVSKEKNKRDKTKIPKVNSNSNISSEGSPVEVEENSQHVMRKHVNIFLSKAIQQEQTDLSSDESLPDITNEKESFNNIKENKTHNTRRSKKKQGKTQNNNSTHKYSHGKESCIPLIKYQQMPVTDHFKSKRNENEEQVSSKETVSKHVYHNESCIPLIRYEPILKADIPRKGSLNNYPAHTKLPYEKTERHSNRNCDKKHGTDSLKKISSMQHKGSLTSYYIDENTSVSEYSEDISITNHTGETESSDDSSGNRNESIQLYERKRDLKEGNVKFSAKDKAETQTSKIMKSFNYKNDIKGFKSHKTKSQVGKAKTKSKNNSDDSYKSDIDRKHHRKDTVSRKCHMQAQDTDRNTLLDSDSISHSDSEVSSNKHFAHMNRIYRSKSYDEFHENLNKDSKIRNKCTRMTKAKSARSRERKDSGSSRSSYSCEHRQITMSTVSKSTEYGESESSNIDVKLKIARQRVRDAMIKEGVREDPKSTMRDKTSKKHKHREAKYNQYSSEDSSASSVPKVKRGMSDVKRLRKHDQRMVDFSMIPYNYDERLPMRFYNNKKNSSSTKYRNQSSGEEVKLNKLLKKRKGTEKKSMYSFSDDGSNSTSTSTLKLTTLAINDDLDHLMPESRRDTIGSEDQYPKLSSYRSLDDIISTSEDFPEDIYEAFPSHNENRKTKKMSSTFSSRTGRWDESDHDQTDGFLLRRPLTLPDSQFTPSFNYRPSSQLQSATFSLINPESDKPENEMVLDKHKSAPQTSKTNEMIKAGIGQCKTHGALLDLYCKTCEEWICNECLDLVHRPPPVGSCVSIPADEAVDHIKASHTEFFDSKVATLDHFKSDLKKLLESCDKGLEEHEKSVAQLSSRVLSEEMIIQGIENMRALVMQKWKQIDQWEDVLEANARRIGLSSSSQEVEEAVQRNSSAILVNVLKGDASEDVPKTGASSSHIW